MIMKLGYVQNVVFMNFFSINSMLGLIPQVVNIVCVHLI